MGQRIYGLCLGYEDLNDHDQLRTDPMLAVAVNKADPLGERRRQASDRGKALAGKCRLNRLELTGAEVDEQERYKKIAMDPNRIDGWMVDAFVESHESAPEEIVLDLDATDDPIHGQQEGWFFHGYYPQKRNRSIAQAELCLNAFRHALPNPKNAPFTTLHTTASLDLDLIDSETLRKPFRSTKITFISKSVIYAG